jgi:hypothetical protein
MIEEEGTKAAAGSFGIEMSGTGSFMRPLDRKHELV